MKTVEILFWVFAFLVFYTYLGYGMLLFLMVKIKEAVTGREQNAMPDELPRVTLVIAAYNEEDVVAEKMANCRKLDYPNLKIMWVTDGTSDKTNELLSAYDDVQVVFTPERRGKSAALNHAMQSVDTPIAVFSDANTMLSECAISEIVREFSNPKVGCVAGEKRVAATKQDATSGEGVYWRYESKLKELDYRLYSVVGAAGELFAVRSELFEALPEDTLLDDFVLSLRIAMRGYRIAYCSKAYALENGSAAMAEENKRKVRIAAGGLQSVARLAPLLNPFRYGILSFQYVSHRVLRWTVTPYALLLLFPLNVVLLFGGNHWLYAIIFLFQLLFYLAAYCGNILAQREIKNKFLFVPYYFMFMNVNVLRGYGFLRRHSGNGTWEKARRA